MITQILELAQDGDGRWVFDETQLRAFVSACQRSKYQVRVVVTRTSGGVPRIRLEPVKEDQRGGTDSRSR